MHRVAGGVGGVGGGRNAESPIDSLEKMVTKGGDYHTVKQKCQLLTTRDLANEKNYHTLLDKFLGFHSLQGVFPLGGWMNRPRVPPRGSADLDTRFALLTSHDDYKWNIYYSLMLMSGDSARDLQMDTQCLPPRTQEFFNGRSPELLEQYSTDNSKRLYEQIFYSRTLPHARTSNSGGGSKGGAGGGGGGGLPTTLAAGGASQGGANNTTVMTRLPFIVSMLDHYHYCFALWPVTRKYAPIDASSRGGFASSR